jgi:class 3 adenylate cyclase
MAECADGGQDMGIPPFGALSTSRIIRSQELPSFYRSSIVVFSSNPSNIEKQECLEAGVDKYVPSGMEQAPIPSLLEDLASQREIGVRLSGDLGASRPRSGLTLMPRHGRLEQVEKVLSVFVPKQFQELIAPGGMESIELGDAVCKSITILFSDIRDFTTITESMYVNEVMDFLNTYLAFALPELTAEGGFIDKFIGDAIMAIFAHQNGQEQATAAVRAAVRMMQALDFRNNSDYLRVETGIGINTGKTIMGVVGTETRMQPTVLGDAVNLASRTESLCKKYGARILITEYTREKMQQAQEEFLMRLVDHVTVKGKRKACRLYEVIDGDTEQVRKAKAHILPLYEQAMKLFTEGNFEASLAAFEECVALRAEDKPSLLYVERCKELIRNPPTAWDGIYYLDSK